MSTLPKLPEATGNAYTIPNVIKGFIYNGQIDTESIYAPSFSIIIHTYRGNVEDTCLADRSKLMRDFFESMYLNGCIPKSKFDQHNIPKDTNSSGEIVEKIEHISMENQHRPKILNSSKQIRKCRLLIDKKRLKEYSCRLSLYNSEESEKSLNEKCEKKFVSWICKSNPELLLQYQAEDDSAIAYHLVHSHLTLDMLMSNSSGVLKNELQSFVCVRSKRAIQRG